MSDSKIQSVYLTDGMMRRTLAATRALGRQNVRVTCGEESKSNPTFYSRYCHKTHLYPSPRENPNGFIESLLLYLKENKHTCLIPMEQDTLDLILKHRKAFEEVTLLPFVDYEKYRTFRDKSNTIALVEKLGIPHPRSIQPTSPDRVIEETQSLRFPVVIKPRLSWGSRGIRYIDTPEQLKHEYRLSHAEDPLPMVQEQIPQGDKYYVCAIMDENQQLIAQTTHKELRNYPLQNGPSTAQQSVAAPELVDITAQLLKEGGWYGVANADFMIDPRDGTPMFMEINPRFWGPLQASIQAGVNFPHLLLRMASGEKLEPQDTFVTGETCRAFLPYEIIHFFANPQRFRMQPSFFKLFGKQVGYDILSIRDPLPIMGFVLTMLNYAFDPEVWIRMARMEKVGRFIAKLSRKKITIFVTDADVELS